MHANRQAGRTVISARSGIAKSVWVIVGAIIMLAVVAAIGLSGVRPTPTATQTILQTTTQTVTVAKAGTGATLVTNNGTGKANSQPFTATTASVEVRLNVTATAALNFTALYWAIYQVGGSYAVCFGSINSQQGNFVDYCYALTAGSSYYVQVSAASVYWRVAVVEIR